MISFRPISSVSCASAVFKYGRIFYAPGLVSIVPAGCASTLKHLLLGKGVVRPPERLIELSRLITEKAETACRQYEQLRLGPYRPECLTLHVNDYCNLSCRYCLRPRSGNRLKIDAASVRAPLRIIGRNCRSKGIPLTVVFHGWGEPTSDMGLLKEVVSLTGREAGRQGVKLFRYIATNGVISRATAEYLAENFDSIGLSCDGPPAIQDRQRPLGHRDSSGIVERTARILRDRAARYTVRATITPESLDRQEQIADYVCRRLQPSAIRFEPVYGRGRSLFPARLAPVFFEHFLRAKRLAISRGIPLNMSGSRLAQIHGPHCPVLREVLTLVPGGGATACFAGSEPRFHAGASRGGRFLLRTRKIQRLKRILATPVRGCERCFNRFHCAGACPERCYLDGRRQLGSFRCRLNKMSAAEEIVKAAGRLPADEIAWTEFGRSGFAV